MYESTILRDSISEEGYRLTSFCVTFPRFILAELNTHRMLSRNSASSRAIPIEKSIAAIEQDMFIPLGFGAHQKGMQADQSLEGYAAQQAETAWKYSGMKAINYAHVLKDLGVHKAWANRILEPYKWHTAIVTATEWGNYFALRDHQDAQPEFREIAHMMREQYEANKPDLVLMGDWHTPMVTDEELLADDIVDWDHWVKVAVGRCARVSVEQHNGVRDPQADRGLTARLRSNRHLSPFEHPARPFSGGEWDLVRRVQAAIRAARCHNDPHADYLYRQVEFKGNLRGWHSARMDIPFEHDFAEALNAVHH